MENGQPTFEEKWLKRLLDFVQRDLGSLSQQDKRNLFREMSYFCSEDFLEVDWDQYEHSLDLTTPEECRVRTETDEFGKDLNLPRIQKKIIEILTSMNSIQEPQEGRLIESIPLPEMSSFIYSPQEGSIKIMRYPKNPTPENWLILNFISLIEKFETYPIRRCKGKSKDKECGRYFLNLTRREKLFCTPSCASRSIQTKKRDRLREEGKWLAHVRKMRKYQRERYREMMRAKLAPNVKVGRRRNRKED